MLINPNLPSDANTQAVRPARAAGTPQTNTPATQTPASQFDLTRMEALDGDATVPDSAGADEAAAYAQANFLSQPSTALAAQGNLNPDSVYSLLQ